MEGWKARVLRENIYDKLGFHVHYQDPIYCDYHQRLTWTFAEVNCNYMGFCYP